jgi:signal transduction histidine kinase
MALLFDGALLATVAAVGWIVIDVASDPARRRRLACVGALAVAALLWVSGELLVHHSASPVERLWARRVLFLGVCMLPPAWVWSVRVAAGVDAARARRSAALLALPGALAWSCLFWDRSGLFLGWYAWPPPRGPVFFAHAAWAWSLIAVGTGLLLRAVPTRAEGGGGLRVAIVAGALLPLLANAEHVLVHASAVDPTPIALGVSAVLFRRYVMDFAWASAQPPLARAEVVAQMRDGVLVTDLAGRVVDWNEASASLLGTGELEGREILPLLGELRARRGREVEVHGFPLARRGRPFARAAVLVDRSELRRSELRLEVATRLEALGVLASGVAHEINNPLTYVSANQALLDPLLAALAEPKVLERLPEELRARAAEAPELLADCREGTERIQRIVEKLAPFAERGAASAEAAPHDVLRPVEKAVTMVGLGKARRAIPVSRPELLPRVYAAEADVLHVVLHLLLNAIQMGGEDVPIAIAVEADEKGVCICIADGGPGIPEADLAHVFDPFFTTRRPGPNLGLGLSLCWELARRNGGRLEAANRPEGGAVFTLWLPAADL